MVHKSVVQDLMMLSNHIALIYSIQQALLESNFNQFLIKDQMMNHGDWENLLLLLIRQKDQKIFILTLINLIGLIMKVGHLLKKLTTQFLHGVDIEYLEVKDNFNKEIQQLEFLSHYLHMKDFKFCSIYMFLMNFSNQMDL